MRLFIYRHTYRAFAGVETGAPNGPCHQEIIICAETRERADQILLERYRRDDHSTFLFVAVEALGFLGERSFREFPGRRRIQVSEYEIHDGLALEFNAHYIGPPSRIRDE